MGAFDGRILANKTSSNESIEIHEIDANLQFSLIFVYRTSNVIQNRSWPQNTQRIIALSPIAIVLTLLMDHEFNFSHDKNPFFRSYTLF